MKHLTHPKPKDTKRWIQTFASAQVRQGQVRAIWRGRVGELAWSNSRRCAPADLKPWRLLGLGACLGSWCSDGDFVLVQVVRLCHEGAGGVLLLDDVGVAPRHVVDVLRHLLRDMNKATGYD